jgi:hypothetical protein
VPLPTAAEPGLNDMKKMVARHADYRPSARERPVAGARSRAEGLKHCAELGSRKIENSNNRLKNFALNLRIGTPMRKCKIEKFLAFSV